MTVGSLDGQSANTMRISEKCNLLLSFVLILLLCVADGASASALPECKFKCRGQSGSLLKLEEGVTYHYDLEGNTETLVPKSKGPFGETVKLNFKAKVHVSALPQCKTVIQLRDVKVVGPDRKAYHNLQKLEQHPLIVSFHGGKLDTEVCAVHDDDFASLNIKRSVASLLQVSMEGNSGNGQESDVFGVCPTYFKVIKEGDTTVVTKHRDLEKCQYRESFRQSFFAVAHGHASDMQSTPLLDSQFDAEQRLKNGILESATVKEEYLFRPFSNRDNGARTRVYTKLVLENKAPETPQALPNNEPRRIFFENPHETVTSNVQTLMAALHKVTDAEDGSVSPTAAKDFSNLVVTMRRASKEDLLSAYGNCKAGAGFQNRQLAKKVFTDALFAAGSADSVAAAIELLKNNEITGDMSKYWYLSFAFVRHASASVLASAATLLDNPKVPQEAYLGVGSLAGHYCREHNCEEVPHFNQLLAKYTAVLATNAKSSREAENYVIAALKGLRNIRHLNEETANKVTQLMKDGHLSSRLRVAALETAQSDACRGKLFKGASDIFYNRDEDSELRIKAYLVLVECPNPKLANKLSEFLETEPVNQVGAFVTSHLRNLRSSSNPDKEHLRDVLYNVKLRRKFPFDVRKFSQNHEFSYTFDALSSSAAVESNVIFSQKSYLPRSVNLNLTVEVFGHAFNLFELNGRAENLEKVYEKYFGPKGYFRDRDPIQIAKDIRNWYKDIGNRVDDKYKNIISRHSRSVSRADTDRFASKVKLFNSKLDSNIDVDLSLRILGNELSWINLEDIETPLTSNVIIEKMGNFFERGLNSVKDYRRDYKKHYHFLDTQLVYPTSTGFPLRLSAVGSGVVQVKVGSNCDLSAFIKNPKRGYAKFEFVPSASVEVAGEFSIDAYAVEAGVKLAGNLHSATGSEVTLQMLDGHGFDVNIGLPVKKSDILTVNSEVFSFARDQGQVSAEHLLEFNVPRKDHHGCFDQLNALLGLTFCGDVGFPSDAKSLISSSANYPLNGHSKVSFRLEKEDETLTSYHMKFLFDIANPKSRRVEFKLDTPGTRVPREISFLASLTTEPEKTVDLQLISPLERFIVKGVVTENDAEYSLSGLVKVGSANEYKAKLGLIKRGGSTYSPVLEYTSVEGMPSDLKVEGEVMVEKQPGTPRRRYVFKGVRFLGSKRSYGIDGNMALDDHSFSSDLQVTCNQHAAGIRTDFVMDGTKHIKLKGQVSPSEYPDYNLGLDFEYRRGDHEVDNKLTFMHGKDFPPEKMLTFQQNIRYMFESRKNFDVSTTTTLSYPLLGVEGRLIGAVTNNVRKSLVYDVEAKYGKYRAHSKLDAKTSIKELGDYDVNFFLAAFDRELTLVATREIIDAYKSKFTQKLNVNPGRSYDLTAEISHHFGGSEAKLRVIATSTNYPNHIFDAGFVTTPALYDGHCKFSDGNNDKVNGLLQFSRVAPFKGNFKLFVKDLLDSHGEYKLEGQMTGLATVKFLQIDTATSASFDLVKAENKYTGSIRANSEKSGQPKWQVEVNTDTDYTPTTINSRNKVRYSNKELEINFHGDCRGKNLERTYSGGYDFTLPSGRFYAGNMKWAYNLFHRTMNGDFFVDLGYATQRGGPMTRYFLDTYAKNFDLKRYSVDSKFEFGRESSKGDMKFSNMFRSLPHDNRYIIDQETTLSGSAVRYPFEHKGHAALSRTEANFDVTSVFGDYHMKSRGKVLTGIEDKVRHFEFQTEMSTPHESARRIQSETVFHFAQGDYEDETKPHVLLIKQDCTLNERMFKLDGNAELHLKQGFMKGSYMLPGEHRPNTFDLKYKREAVNQLRKAEITFNSNYKNDKHVNLNSVFEYKPDKDLFNGHITCQTSLQSLKNVEFTFSHKKLSSTARNTDFTAILNGEKVEGFAKYEFAPKQSSIDLTVNNPAGKSRFYYKLNKKSDRQATSEGQIAWVANGGGQCDFSSNVDVESYENFHILIKINSEKLDINKLKLEVGNRATKSGTGKKINFVAQTADKKGFSGSATYAIKELSNGFTIEGKGQIEFQADKHPLTYKAEYKTLSKAGDGETGTLFTLNADFEKGNFLAQQKLTDKELLYVSKFCKDDRCAHTEVKNKMQITDYTEMGYDAAITYQNNLGGRNDDFRVFAKTHRKNFYVDHESGLRVLNRAYNFKYYVHDGEGGLVFDFPHREIAAIASYDLPFDLSTRKLKADFKNVQVRFDGSLYLDRRNKPNEKGNLYVTGDFAVSGKSVSSKGEIKVSHPALNKDLVLRGKGAAGLDQRLLDVSFDVDIFNRKNQRITFNTVVDYLRAHGGRNVTGKIEFVSKGMNIDVATFGHLYVKDNELTASSSVHYHDSQNVLKDASVYLGVHPKRFNVLFKIPNREVLRIDSVVEGEPQHQIINTEVNVADLRHYVARIETVGLHSLHTTVFRKDIPDVKLNVVASVSPKLLEFRVDKSKGPANDNFFLLQLTSQKEAGAKPVFSLDNEKIKHCMHECKAEAKDLVQQVKTVVGSVCKESFEEYKNMVKNVKKIQPDFKPLLQYYESEFSALRKEIASDPEFSKFSIVYQNLFGGIIEVLERFVESLVKSYSRISQEAAELQVKMAELYKEVLTRVTESYKKMYQPLYDSLEYACDAACSGVEHVLDFLKANEEEISQALVIVSGYVQDFTHFCMTTFEQLKNEAEEFSKVIVKQLKSLPIYMSFEEKYKELTNVELPQTLKNLYSEVVFAAEDIMKTPELRDLIENVMGYFLKFPVPSILVKLPKVGPLREFTFIRYLKTLSELPSLSEVYHTYRPFLHPEDNIPPFKAYATIVGSNHFFTFDQKHFALKGTCSYVLAQDFLDGNFSIVANFENGKMKSISMNDDKDSVEMFNDNTVSLNGQHGDYPINHNNFNGWVRYGTFNMKHKSGVHVTKYLNQDMIIFRVSGFYFGRTRGLLGTISNEHYDDFLLPNGHIAKDTKEFIDAYAVNDGCPAALDYPPSQERVPECTKFFSSDSNLHSGFVFVNHENYREACDQYASHAADKHKAACDVVSAYVLALKQGYQTLAHVPDECVTCTINGVSTPYGQEVEVQTPTGKADVIFVFEQSAFNHLIFKEMLTPLIPALSHDLKEKGLGDVEFALIGYGGPKNEWPVHYPNHGKVTYMGNADKITFKTTEDPKPSYATWEDKIRALVRYINTELGHEPIVMAMEEANIYPFRQGAAKVIILVNSQSCPISSTYPFSLQTPRIFSIRKYYKDLGLQFYFVTPLAKAMTLNNKPDTELKNVVGFDSHKIYTFGDAKKSELEGDATNRPHLVFDHDLCVSFSQYNGGATFNSNVFAHAKPEQQKKFVSVMSRRIAKGVVENRFKETCTCQMYHGLFYYPKCKVVGTL